MATGITETITKSYNNITSNKEDSVNEQHVRNVYTAYLTHVKLDGDALRNLPPERQKELLDSASRKYRLTPKRKQKIVTRLKDSGYEVCLQAIQNIGKSDWHHDNEDGKWFAHIDWVLGSFEKTEEWANKEAS